MHTHTHSFEPTRAPSTTNATQHIAQRRAVRYGREVLGGAEGFFAQLVDVVVSTFGDAYPELRQARDRIHDVIAEEEASFSRTLVKGIEKFKKLAAAAEVRCYAAPLRLPRAGDPAAAAPQPHSCRLLPLHSLRLPCVSHTPARLQPNVTHPCHPSHTRRAASSLAPTPSCCGTRLASRWT